ncbi:MAG: DUF3108 domain-containing protein [Qingshengfaniella sp.]
MTDHGPSRSLPRALGLACLLGLAVPPAWAQEKAGFTVSFAGLRAGTLAYEASETDGRYEARGSVRSGGLAGIVFNMRIDATATGQVTGNRYAPTVYAEIAEERGETVSRRFRYPAGWPEITRDPPRDRPRRHAAPADQQGGTVDPMTAVFAVLRDRPASLACQLDIALYDGATRARIRLDQPSPIPNGLRCTGRYEREAGFSPAAMARQSVWPLTLTYRTGPEGILQVQDLQFQTNFGAARIQRR